MFNKIHHVAIICSNYELSKHFYTDIIGCQIIAETYREDRQSWKLDLALSNGDRIELFSFPNTPERVSRPEARGLRHLAFEVDNVANTVNYLNSKNIDTEAIRVDSITGKKFTFFQDPDNLPLEIYER